MPVPLLIVELPASDVGRPEAAALIEACTAGLRAGRCEVRDGSPPDAATAVGVVAWLAADHSSALVEVGRRDPEGQTWLNEQLVFQPGDAMAERFRALGLTMAALFRELDASTPASRQARLAKPATASASAALPSSTVPRGGDEPPPEASHRAAAVPRASVSLGPYAAGDAQLGSPRWGVLAGVFVRPLQPPLWVTLSARYAVAAPSGLTMNWSTLGLGLGWTWPLPRDLGVRARLEGLAERVGATAAGDTGEEGAQASHWVGGGRLGLDLSWTSASFWGLSLNLETTRFWSRTVVTVHGVEAAGTGSWVYAAGLALELHPFVR